MHTFAEISTEQKSSCHLLALLLTSFLGGIAPSGSGSYGGLLAISCMLASQDCMIFCDMFILLGYLGCSLSC